MGVRRGVGDYAELRARVRAALRERDVSMRRASLRAGVGANTIHALLSDHGRQPSTETCRRLARYFKWAEADVLRWAGHLPAALAAAPDPLAAITEIVERTAWSPVRKAWVLDVVQRAQASESSHAQRATQPTADWRRWN